MVQDTRQRSAARARKMMEEVQGMCGVRVFSAFLIELTRLHLFLLPPSLRLAFIVLGYHVHRRPQQRSTRATPTYRSSKHVPSSSVASHGRPAKQVSRVERRQVRA
jgi:hypothetical protein